MGDRSQAWHQSTLELIGNCSWKYFLTYIIGLPDPSGVAAEIGTAVHAAVEKYETARLQKVNVTREEIETCFVHLPADSIASANVAYNNWENSSMKNKELSHKMWLNTMVPVTLEEYFTFPLVEKAMPIGGTIDGVYLDGGLYRVVDLKTSKDMSRWKDSGEGKRLQATMYSVAIQLKYNLDYFPAVTYAVTRTNRNGETAKRVHIQPDFQDVRDLGDKIRQAQRIVDTEDYVKNPAYSLCSLKWCPFYTGCMVTHDLSGTPVTLRQKFAVPKTSLLGAQFNTTTDTEVSS